MSPIPTVATSKTPGMEIRKARPSGDSHGLADFHLRPINSLPAGKLTSKLPCY